MIKYILYLSPTTSMVNRVADGAWIPLCEDNCDYLTYLQEVDLDPSCVETIE